MPLFGRKIYFIKKDFQSRFIVRFVVITTVWATGAIALFALMAERKLQEVLYSPHITVSTTAELLMPSAFQAHLISLLLFTVILLYAIHALWKRLSVPLHSLKKDIVRIAGGDLVSGVALREEEEFQDLAADLDGMRGELRRKVTAMKERHEELSEAAEAIEKALIRGTLSADQVAVFREKVLWMREELHEFTY